MREAGGRRRLHLLEIRRDIRLRWLCRGEFFLRVNDGSLRSPLSANPPFLIRQGRLAPPQLHLDPS
jgi:hypothetical protein